MIDFDFLKVLVADSETSSHCITCFNCPGQLIAYFIVENK